MGPEAWAAIIGAMTGGVISAVGWFVSSILTERGIRQQAQRAAVLERLKEQIGGLYGPISGLIQQSASVHGVAKTVLPTTPDQKLLDMSKFSAAHSKAWNFLCEQYFFPMNRQITSLLYTHLYLLENQQIPESFKKFFDHAAQFEVRHLLWKETGFDTSSIPGPGWPSEFPDDITHSLDRLHQKLFELIGEKTGAIGKA